MKSLTKAGLLLGLFFIAVGMSVDLGLAIERPAQVLGLARE